MTSQFIDQIYIHSSNGMYKLPYIQSYINDLACNSITIQAQDVGSAHIVSIPDGAKVYIDGIEQVGVTTPATVNNIPSVPFEHTYKLIKPGYIDAEGSLFIITGQTYNVTVTMCKISSDFWPLLLGLAFTGSIILMMIEKESKKDKEQKYKDIKDITDKLTKHI